MPNQVDKWLKMPKRPVNVIKKIFYKAVTGAGRLADPSFNSTPLRGFIRTGGPWRTTIREIVATFFITISRRQQFIVGSHFRPIPILGKRC